MEVHKQFFDFGLDFLNNIKIFKSEKGDSIKLGWSKISYIWFGLATFGLATIYLDIK